MRRLVVVLFTLMSLALAASAHAAECVPAPLPTTPVPPVYGMDMEWSSSDKFHLDLWRQPCTAGGYSILLRITPITVDPFICGGSFHFVQGATQYTVSLRTSFSGTTSFCDELFVPMTFVPFVSTGPPPLNIAQAFSLLFSGTSTLYTLNVPAADTAPPAPPTVTVVATGCTTCHPGNFIAYEARVTNPGPPVLVEFKGGARLPDGTPVNLLGLYLEKTFPTGTTVVQIVYGSMPSGITPGTYVVEAALLEPALGTTISRASAPVTVAP